MLVRVLQTSIYRDVRIYFRQLDNDFEYLAVLNGEIYSARVTIKKHWWQKLFFLPFNEKQLLNATNYMATVAHTTIDTILDKPKE